MNLQRNWSQDLWGAERMRLRRATKAAARGSSKPSCIAAITPSLVVIPSQPRTCRKTTQFCKLSAGSCFKIHETEELCIEGLDTIYYSQSQLQGWHLAELRVAAPAWRSGTCPKNVNTMSPLPPWLSLCTLIFLSVYIDSKWFLFSVNGDKNWHC